MQASVIKTLSHSLTELFTAVTTMTRYERTFHLMIYGISVMTFHSVALKRKYLLLFRTGRLQRCKRKLEEVPTVLHT